MTSHECKNKLLVFSSRLLRNLIFTSCTSAPFGMVFRDGVLFVRQHRAKIADQPHDFILEKCISLPKWST